MAMAIDESADEQSQTRKCLEGSILENLKLRFPSGLVLGEATCFFLKDVTFYWYTFEKQSINPLFVECSTTDAIMQKTIKNEHTLKKGEPYPIRRYDDECIYLCDFSDDMKIYPLTFESKSFGVRIERKEVRS